MNLLRKYLPAFLLVISAIACKKDFLHSTQRTTLVREEYVQDLQSCGEYLNGLYMDLSFSHNSNNSIYPDLIADNIKPVTGQSITSSHYSWTQAADEETFGNQNMNGFSYAYYNIIVSCNFLLGKISSFRSEDPARADDIKGQTLALRAFSYFQLVNMFAQPYSFTPAATHPGIVYTDAVDWTTAIHHRNTVQQIYQSIARDLSGAITLLPVQPPSTVRFTKNAAMSLLARVCLYRQDYAQAAGLAATVASAVPLVTKTKGYPNDLFKHLPPQNTEVLLQLLPGSSISLGHSGGGIFPGRYFRASKQYVATSDIAAILHAYPSDLRKSWVTYSGGTWNITKFPTGLIPDVLPADDAYLLPVVRSSEMFLTAAESYSHLGMDDSARYYLNAVRKRAGIDTLGLHINSQALLDSVYTERRRELAFEGLRMQDLMRWKKPVHRKDAPNPAAVTLPYPSNRAIAPIPKRDVLLSGIEQNPGY